MSAKEDGTTNRASETVRDIEWHSRRTVGPSFSRDAQILSDRESRVERHSLDDTRAETSTYLAVKIAIFDYQFLLYMRYPVVPRFNFIGRSEQSGESIFPLLTLGL